MRRYEIYGRKFIAEGEQLYVEVLEATLADEARPAKRHYKKHKKIADFPPPEKPEKKKKGSARQCAHCGKVPKETAVCLVCSEQISYKTHYCCETMREHNKRHVTACGSGTLILLNINSTYVFIIRGKRCAPWASLYLDEHGEEDRDLK